MDAQTLSAEAAWGAAAVALVLAGIQFYIGRKQAEAALTSAKAALMNAQNAGRHTIAESRQKWIDKVIDTLVELYSIVAAHSGELCHDHSKAVIAARTKLGILLNPDEADTIELLAKIDSIVADGIGVDGDGRSAEMLTVARRLLKREWVRIKSELA